MPTTRSFTTASSSCCIDLIVLRVHMAASSRAFKWLWFLFSHAAFRKHVKQSLFHG